MSRRLLITTNIISGLGFLFVFTGVSGGNMLRYTDAHLNFFMPRIWTPAVNEIVLFLTSLTRPVPAIILILTIGVLLVYRHRWQLGTILLVSIPTAIYSSKLLKLVAERQRPIGGLVNEIGYALPSTHATVGGLLIGGVWIIKQSVKKLHYTYMLGAALLIVSAFLGFSRLYLGVHWLSDIIAGYMLGIFWASFFLLIYQLIADRVYKDTSGHLL